MTSYRVVASSWVTKKRVKRFHDKLRQPVLVHNSIGSTTHGGEQLPRWAEQHRAPHLMDDVDAQFENFSCRLLDSSGNTLVFPHHATEEPVQETRQTLKMTPPADSSGPPCLPLIRAVSSSWQRAQSKIHSQIVQRIASSLSLTTAVILRAGQNEAFE
jgi:hypothetical protein